MKNIKRISISVLSLFIVIGLHSVQAIDYASNEQYYKDLCSSSAAKDNKSACLGFNNYLQEKANNASSNAESYKGKISELQGNIEEQVALANEYQEKIDALDAEIVTLEANIVQLQNNIAEIEAEIEEREEEIAEKDRIIVERMIKTQSDMRFGYEIDFLFKAQSFETLIASMSVVNDIMDFERIQIEEIDALIEQQKTDQETLVVQQETIEINLVSIEASKNETTVLKAEVDIAVKNYQTLMAEMEANQAQSYADANAIRNQIASNQEAMKDLEELPSSGGFTRPISGGYVSARVWAYPAPWSATHLGYDYATGGQVGVPIYAAANGIVLFSADSCPTYGGLGNMCGGPQSGGGLYGGGNQVHLLVSVENQLYALNYSHMQSGSPIATGTIVSGGTQIGRIGTSGNSTGPHVHVEIYYLGTETIQQYMARWNGNLGHNVGFSLARRCMDGYGAPCRVDPGTKFGYN